MKKSVLFTLILMSLSSLEPVNAYTFKEENKPISSRRVLDDAAQIGLSIKSDEISAKEYIRSWPERTKKKHLDTDAPDSLLLEGKDSGSNLSEAKVIARQQIYRGVEKHWSWIKDSVLNEPAADSFAKFAPYLKRELDKLEFIQSKDTKGYLFNLPWADIRVDKKLKKVSWVIRIGSHLDGNRLVRGAEQIIVPERSAE